MDFVTNNKLFCLSFLSTLSFGGYLFKKSIENLQDRAPKEDFDEAKLKEEVAKMVKKNMPLRTLSFDSNHESNKQSANEIYKICLTGGPCGGKTTGNFYHEKFV
jgi:hypothetical protein